LSITIFNYLFDGFATLLNPPKLTQNCDFAALESKLTC